ncbi:ABC transporter permease [Hyphomicrobium sp.]|uniref:ABC transporter permease n=1 Tax=Hyphomicrobium sp. TaxID=82 RepID=UPI002CA2EB21|nr:ABC transporter permease [Hyphomicrobium sp.]HRN89322.1 ABC transporter permease [Hyphomicrobium sp.]HRQ27430.1 ABC transporter permease [Hyphomicrobium sp.]
MQQLLWLETLLKLAGGILLLLAPMSTIRAFGLPASASGFWPRIVGALLIGVAAATYIEGAWAGSRGLGLAGLVVINLTGAFVIALSVLMGRAAPTRRGAFALWVLVALLVSLSLVEIAQA